jgi:hypothetical protein
MSFARPFAYNTGSTISGTEQLGDLAIGVDDLDYTGGVGGVTWWNGPDEELGYVIAQPVPDDSQPTPIPGVTGSVGFFRTNGFDDNEFIDITNILLNSNYNNAPDASTGLTTNGYWNSYSTLTSPVLSLDAADYSGSGPWIDSVGGKSFTLTNSPTWSSSNGGYFNFVSSSSQYAICNTSLPSMSTWTVGVWHYYTGTETGAAPCIVTETFIGGSINYSLGKNLAPFSVGFFNGSWRITDGYSLTPNNWYYIVGTYDGSTIKLYVNNTLVDSTNYTGTPTTSGAGIRLMERWDLSDYWGGRLAIVDIFDTALDQTEITTIWNSTKTRFGL